MNDSESNIVERIISEATANNCEIESLLRDDFAAASAYLRDLMANCSSDEMNRGFNLEYYDGISKSPEILRVETECEPPLERTFEVLHGRLETDCCTGNSRAMTSIDLHTLCSLCMHHHILGRLAEDKRTKAIDLLTRIRELCSRECPPEFISYLEAVYSILVRTNASVGSIFVDLLALKETRRSGWNASRRTGDTDIQRHCPNPESVGDHVWGCLLIAEAFLPASHADPTYSKPEIMRMLLIHDLAEAFTGDKPSFQKTNIDQLEEKRLMRQISALSSFRQFEGMKPWWDAWENLSHMQELNALVAWDIDVLENYLQLMRYRRDPQSSIPDAEEWARYVSERLKTEIGREIFNSLRQQGADFLRWFKDEPLP